MTEEYKAETGGFTALESKIVMSIVRNMKGDLQADFDAVAQECGYKDSTVAKARWNQIKRKKVAGSLTIKTTSGGKKGKRGKAGDGDSGGDDNAKANSGAKRAKSKADIKREDSEETNEAPLSGDEGVKEEVKDVKPVKRGRGRPKKKVSPSPDEIVEED